MSTGFFFSGALVGLIVGQLLAPTVCKAACVETSGSVSYCSSSAPMPTHEVHGVVVITGNNTSALDMQNASDQTARDNAAIAQAQADYQRYLDGLARDRHALVRALVNGY